MAESVLQIDLFNLRGQTSNLLIGVVFNGEIVAAFRSPRTAVQTVNDTELGAGDVLAAVNLLDGTVLIERNGG